MTTYTTYESQNTSNPNERWVAYINGWKVFCFGATEQAAKDRAQRLWEGERAKAQPEASDSGWTNTNTWSKPEAKGTHHFAGKVWMRHKEHGLMRAPASEVANLEAKGYYRSGPRGK